MLRMLIRVLCLLPGMLSGLRDPGDSCSRTGRALCADVRAQGRAVAGDGMAPLPVKPEAQRVLNEQFFFFLSQNSKDIECLVWSPTLLINIMRGRGNGGLKTVGGGSAGRAPRPQHLRGPLKALQL